MLAKWYRTLLSQAVSVIDLDKTTGSCATSAQREDGLPAHCYDLSMDTLTGIRHEVVGTAAQRLELEVAHSRLQTFVAGRVSGTPHHGHSDQQPMSWVRPLSAAVSLF